MIKVEVNSNNLTAFWFHSFIAFILSLSQIEIEKTSWTSCSFIIAGIMAGWRLERQHPNDAGGARKNAEQAGGRYEERKSFGICLLTSGNLCALHCAWLHLCLHSNNGSRRYVDGAFMQGCLCVQVYCGNVESFALVACLTSTVVVGSTP
jgi:hypothetical protein